MYNDRILQYEYEMMEKDLEKLLYKHKGKIHIDSMGKSWDKREIYRIAVGRPDAARKILFTGAIHGREYITARLLIKQTEQFLESISKSGKDYENTTVYVIPMVNPDGVALCHRGAEGIRDKKLRQEILKIKRQDAKKKADCEYFIRWKANARGVDLNRNFDAFWGKYESGNSSPSSEKYKGEYPESEIETKLLTNFTRKEKFSATVSYHSSGEVIYWDFGQRGELREKTEKMAKGVSYVTGYKIEDGWDQTDPAGYKDWAVLKMEIPSVTIEIGKGDSPLLQDEFPQIWEKNKHVWESIINIM